MSVKNLKALIVSILMLGFLSACATNPVTGKREISLVGEEWEINVGKQAYLPYRQAQGGDYVVDPRVEEYVNEVGQRLAQASDRKLPYEFNVLNSSVPNAWALPGGKIAINRGLLTELNSEAELAAVLGHEIVHAAARHGAKAQTRGMGLQIGIIGAAIAGGQGYGQAASLGAQLINQKYGRGAELESDEYGMLYMSRSGYDPKAAIDLQETFVRLSEGRKSDWVSGLFASHPPSQQRVTKNKENAAKLPAGGEMGADRYKRELRSLFKSKPAYEAYDEAVELANKGEYSKARSLVKKAKKIEPRESLFDLLEGDLAEEAGNSRAAMSSFNRAVTKNPDFFAPLAKRGALKYEMGDTPGAKKDLKRSMDLLPGYAVTHYTLGRIALDEGRRADAIKHFDTASKSKSKVGQKSYTELLKLDLPNNPQKYVQSRASSSNSGELIIQLANATSVDIRNIIVDVQIKDKRGRNDVIQRRFRGTLGAKKQATIRTGIGAANISSARARVVNARLAN